MTTKVNLKRKRGDTNFIPFQIQDSDCNPVDISLWTGFLLTIDTRKTPDDATTVLQQITGTIIDAALGRIGFSPDGTLDPGRFYYDAQATDDNGKKRTFAEGRYTVSQDITKD